MMAAKKLSEYMKAIEVETSQDIAEGLHIMMTTTAVSLRAFVDEESYQCALEAMDEITKKSNVMRTQVVKL
jgi:hypothetical protein